MFYQHHISPFVTMISMEVCSCFQWH